jgi:hypothetical protein
MSVEGDLNKPAGKVFRGLKALPVRITKAVALSRTDSDLPRILTLAGRSVIALASRSDLKDRPFMLSRNSAGEPPINSVLIRFSSSSSVAPAVMALGWRPYAMM